MGLLALLLALALLPLVAAQTCVYDNCPTVANPGQEDYDFDGVGNACDFETDQASCSDGFDNDGDGLCDRGCQCSAANSYCGTGNTGLTSLPLDPDCAPWCSACSDCGQGVFNLCDRQECGLCPTPGSCAYFPIAGDSWGSCESCSLYAQCQDYPDQQSCEDDACGNTQCAWNLNISSGQQVCCVDADTDGFCDDVDCNAGDPLIHPGAEELCDEVDNDCDGIVDNGCDKDADGYCDIGRNVTAPTPSTCPSTDFTNLGLLPGTSDCSDNDSQVYPGSPEWCNDIDDDCDGIIDEGCDDDGDGYCDAALNLSTSSVCPSGGNDCDDTRASVHPGQPDASCDNLDSDCDGSIDEEYVQNASCGVGHCLLYNTPSSCVGGVETPCMPAPPLSFDDLTCDEYDDDCDGLLDDDVDCYAKVDLSFFPEPHRSEGTKAWRLIKREGYVELTSASG